MRNEQTIQQHAANKARQWFIQNNVPRDRERMYLIGTTAGGRRAILIDREAKRDVYTGQRAKLRPCDDCGGKCGSYHVKLIQDA